MKLVIELELEQNKDGFFEAKAELVKLIGKEAWGNRVAQPFKNENDPCQSRYPNTAVSYALTELGINIEHTK